MTWQVGACKRARASVSSSKFPRELPSTPPCSQHHPSLSRSNFPQLRKRCYDRSRAERYHRPGNFQEPSSSLSSQADFPATGYPSLSSIERGIGVPRGNNQRGKPISFLEFDNDFVSIFGRRARSPSIVLTATNLDEVCHRFAARILHANLPTVCFPNSSRHDPIHLFTPRV